ncbi:MAG: bifunctional glycosyltransferase family 2/GtrA family protein [Actinobacteria bacterium]|nr:bifunctional glycosyltransferase family 2/GtrA family protein [Actinomycetota bacterium]
MTLTEDLRTATAVVDIVIPVYNEAGVLADSVTTLHRFLTNEFPFTWRITIADNASTDTTWQVASVLAATMDGVRAIHLDQKGRGRALRTAWTDNDAAIVAYMDVDLSTRLDALLPLIAPLVSGHSDVAIGSRLATGSAVARGPRREFISRTYNTILRAVFGNGFRDAQCGFKAVRREVAEKLLPMVQDQEWFFDTELLLLAERNGLRVHEVPVTWIDDPDSRVHVVSTARDDLKGVVRMANTFMRGRGVVDLGDAARPPLADDFGRQLVLFAKIGVISTLISLALFLVLRGSVGAVWANLIAVGATAVGNTWANRRYTFGYRDSRQRGRHYMGGVAISLAGLLLTSLALTAVTGSVAQVVVLLASWSLATVARFGLLRNWVFQARA